MREHVYLEANQVDPRRMYTMTITHKQVSSLEHRLPPRCPDFCGGRICGNLENLHTVVITIIRICIHI